MRYLSLGCLIIAVLHVFTALPKAETANTEEDKTITLMVTGTHIPGTTEANSLPKFIITAEDIATVAANSFADVLAAVPGIDIFEQGGVGGLTFLSIRGGDPNFVVILIDGVKVNDPTNSRGGAFDLGTIDPAVIEKVEVYYGSFSTVYGSDALAGVVSIETKKFTEHQTGTASFKVGANDTLGGSVHFGMELDDIAELSVIGSFQDGDDSTFGDAFNRQELIASLTSVADSNIRWNMAFFVADGEAATFPEDSGGDRLAVFRAPETRNYSQNNFTARVQRRLGDELSLDFKSGWSARKEDISNPGIAEGILDGVPAIDSMSNYERLDISATGTYQLSEQSIIALGATYAKEYGGMDSIIDFGFPVPAEYTLKRKTNSIFAEARLQPVEKLHLTAGFRHDKSGLIKVTTGRLITRYQLTDSSIVSTQYSEGFKLPSFFAVGHPLVGNPDLKPEQSKNYDISVDNNLIDGKLTSRISIYKNIFTDLIDFDPIDFTNVNRSKVNAKGAELYLAYNANEQLNLSGQITYNKMSTDEGGVVLRRRPKLKASLEVNYSSTTEISLKARLIVNDDYYDSSIPTGMITMPGYNHLDLSAVWTLSDSLMLRLYAKNILDNDKEQTVGFNNIGRSLTVKIFKEF